MYRVLIVDDEQLTRNFLKQTIPKLNGQWEVVGEAEEGYEALDILCTTAVDLVITDIKMPEMDGLELCKHLYEKYPKVHCAILSGYGEFNYAQKAIEYQVKNYLLKPIVKEELINLLNTIASQLDEEIKRQEIYNTLLSSSENYKEEITSKFLKAVITNAHVEIKSLYPILYNLNISIIEAEGIILIFHLTEDMLIDHHIPISQLGLLKLMLYNIAKRCTQGTPHKVFFDLEENVLILVPINNADAIKEIIDLIYSKLNTAFYNETHLNCFCTIGSLESDLLLMNQSYQNAREALSQYLFSKNPPAPYYIYNELFQEENLKTLNKYMTSMLFFFHQHDPINLQLVVKDLAHFVLQNIAPASILKFLFILLHKFEEGLTKNHDVSILYKKTIEESNLSHLTDSDFYILLTKLMDAFTKYYGQTHESKDGPVLIKKTKHYIYDHYMEPISLSLIADYLSVSASYLSNLFHESEGQSYIKYLTEVRMKQAINLLKECPEMKLETITEKVGYISVKHFSFVFKKYYHVSPGEYRKNLK